MKLSQLFIGAALLASASAWAQAPKYIFLYIGDGMGMGPVNTAQTYNRTILHADKPLTMMQMPVVGWCTTYSASDDITDSAAAGTALSTGYKTKNGMLGQNADSVAVESMALKLKRMGYGVGIATTVAADDATPSAFYAHVPSRKHYTTIVDQLAASDYEFVAGAGLKGFADKEKGDALREAVVKSGRQIVRGPEGIKQIDADKVLLLNTEGTVDYNVGYTIDSVAGVLTPAMIADACIKHLERTSPDKFFMMFEGGNIDHALHANDGGAAIKEVLAFDQALAYAYDFYLAHPDETLIVVTADHDTGGLAQVHAKLPGGGLANIDLQKVSKEEFSAYCKAILKSRRIFTWDDMKEYLSDNLGFFSHIRLSDDQEERLRELFDDTFELRNTADQETLYANFNAFAVEVFRIFNDASGIAFTTLSHSGNPVPVFAVGVGADAFKGYNTNTDIPAAILKTVK